MNIFDCDRNRNIETDPETCKCDGCAARRIDEREQVVRLGDEAISLNKLFELFQHWQKKKQ